MRWLSPEEARDLGKVLLGDEQTLPAVVRALRAAPSDETAVALLPALLDTLWQDGLRDRIEESLRHHLVQVAEKHTTTSPRK